MRSKSVSKPMTAALEEAIECLDLIAKSARCRRENHLVMVDREQSYVSLTLYGEERDNPPPGELTRTHDVEFIVQVQRSIDSRFSLFVGYRGGVKDNGCYAHASGDTFTGPTLAPLLARALARYTRRACDSATF